MTKISGLLKRYRAFLVLLLIYVLLFLFAPDIGKRSLSNTLSNIREMLMVLPPIFILLGLMDVWIEKETMMKYMGEGSGLRGTVLAFLMGSLAAGPLYAAFPVAGILMKKRVRLFNVFIFIGAWSTTKVPMLLFETSSLGAPFMLLRLLCNVIGIILIAIILEKTTNEAEKDLIYQLNENR